jgi:hypothetical protein
MNSVHDRHVPDGFWGLIHLILTFHDSTFECVGGSLPEVSRVTDVTRQWQWQSPQG